MKVTLPDGTPLELPDGASGADAAAAIGPGLARAALAVKQDGEVRDLARPLTAGEPLEIVTDRSGAGRARPHPPRRRPRARRRGHGALPGREDLDRPADRERLLLRLRLPRRRQPLRRRLRGDRGEDARAHRRRRAVRRARTSRSTQALERFRAEGQDYKVELIEDLVAATTGVDTVSLYTNGPFTDLCRGPHAPSTKRIGAFKLQSVAGAYWRGDANRQMLTRVYGTAFFKQAELDAFLEQLEQARARDHRKLGRELGLFTFSPTCHRARPSGCRRAPRSSTSWSR